MIAVDVGPSMEPHMSIVSRALSTYAQSKVGVNGAHRMCVAQSMHAIEAHPLTQQILYKPAHELQIVLFGSKSMIPHPCCVVHTLSTPPHQHQHHPYTHPATCNSAVYDDVQMPGCEHVEVLLRQDPADVADPTIPPKFLQLPSIDTLHALTQLHTHCGAAAGVRPDWLGGVTVAADHLLQELEERRLVVTGSLVRRVVLISPLVDAVDIDEEEAEGMGEDGGKQREPSYLVGLREDLMVCRCLCIFVGT